jgi:hypothetical protein
LSNCSTSKNAIKTRPDQRIAHWPT